MPYPFTQHLTFSQFADRLHNEFGCELKRTTYPLTREGGRSTPIRYFERVADGDTLQASIDLADEDFVRFSVMRSLCAQLRIPVEAFGLELG